MTADQIRASIEKAFPDAEIKIIDLAGDNNHWAVSVTSAAFAGLSRVRQHKLVYSALGEGVGTDVHALQVQTKVPA